MAIALLVFASVLREGVGRSSSSARRWGRRIGRHSLRPGGIGRGDPRGLLVFAAGAKLRLRRFFAVTNVFLLLFAAGLVGKAAGELGEAGLVPPLISRLWDLNPPEAEGAPYPAFHENGLIGTFFKGLFGYSATLH